MTKLNQENFYILIRLTKPKGVTTQIKALDEYFLMVVFTLSLNRVHVFVNFMLRVNRELLQYLISDNQENDDVHDDDHRDGQEKAHDGHKVEKALSRPDG